MLLAKDGSGSQRKVSNANVEVQFTLQCRQLYELKIDNYPRTMSITGHDEDGIESTRVITYDPKMVAKAKLLEMAPEQKMKVEKKAEGLQDTTFISNSKMSQPVMAEAYAQIVIHLKMIDSLPLSQECLWITGQKQGKSFKGTTNTAGELVLFVPKGDAYALHFQYNKNYSQFEVPYYRDHSKTELHYSYLGTKEIKKRKEEEADRIRAEEKNLKEGEERFAAYCKKRGISLEEGRRLELESSYEDFSQFADTVIMSVLNRNNWNNKLIVCDLTASMNPYYR